MFLSTGNGLLIQGNGTEEERKERVGGGGVEKFLQVASLKPSVSPPPFPPQFALKRGTEQQEMEGGRAGGVCVHVNCQALNHRLHRASRRGIVGRNSQTPARIVWRTQACDATTISPPLPGKQVGQQAGKLKAELSIPGISVQSGSTARQKEGLGLPGESTWKEPRWGRGGGEKISIHNSPNLVSEMEFGMVWSSKRNLPAVAPKRRTGTRHQTRVQFKKGNERGKRLREMCIWFTKKWLEGGGGSGNDLGSKASQPFLKPSLYLQ